MIREGNLRIVALQSTAHLRYRVRSWMARVVKVGEVVEVKARLLGFF